MFNNAEIKERISPAEPATPDFETGILPAEERNGEGADKPEDKAADMDLNDTASEEKDKSAPQPDAAETEAEKMSKIKSALYPVLQRARYAEFISKFEKQKAADGR